MTSAASFPAVAGLRWMPVDGGFSGASIWRGDDPAHRPQAALKCLPAGFPADRLRRVHRWMAAAQLPVVPVVFRTANGDTTTEADGRAWECIGWMPGEPLMVEQRPPTTTHSPGWPADNNPSLQRTVRACSVLASLHRIWSTFAQPPASPPCIARRQELFAAVVPHLASPPAHLRDAASFVRSALLTARTALDKLIQSGPIHPCLCDARPEHFLFTGDSLTGVIDFAAMKLDHPAVDLARLLMDTVHLDDGIAAYHAAEGSAAVTPALVRTLADTGRVGAIANWILRLANQEPTPAEADRLERLLARVVH